MLRFTWSCRFWCVQSVFRVRGNLVDWAFIGKLFGICFQSSGNSSQVLGRMYFKVLQKLQSKHYNKPKLSEWSGKKPMAMKLMSGNAKSIAEDKRADWWMRCKTWGCSVALAQVHSDTDLRVDTARLRTAPLQSAVFRWSARLSRWRVLLPVIVYNGWCKSPLSNADGLALIGSLANCSIFLLITCLPSYRNYFQIFFSFCCEKRVNCK